MVRRYAVGVLACLAAVPLSLTGCAEKHEASQTLPPVSAPAPSSPSQSSLGPQDLPMPTAARQPTAAGFNEFVKYYIALMNRLDDELDGSYLRKFSSHCVTCDRLARDATADAGKGYRYEGGTATITYLSPARLTESGAEAAFTVDQSAYRVIDSTGNAVPGLSGEALTRISSGAAGIWVKDHWVLTQLTFG